MAGVPVQGVAGPSGRSGGSAAVEARDQRGREGFAELCYQAADGDPWLALWLAVCFLPLYRRRREVRA